MAKSRKATKRKSNGLLSQKWSWKLVLPILVIFAGLGGYYVWQTFAYTYTTCNKNWLGAYEYSPTCVTDSDEAKIARLYFASFGRIPDRNGLDYWTKRLVATDRTKMTLEQIADSFVNSTEFKNKFGSLSNENFVKQIYKQVLGRDVDPSGLSFYKTKLDNKSITRAGFVTSLSESNENKHNSISRVATALGIKFAKSDMKKISTGKVECLGTISTYNGNQWCSVKLSAPSPRAILKITRTMKGNYAYANNQFSARLIGVDNNFVIAKNRPSNGSFNPTGGFSVVYNFNTSLSSKSIPLNAYAVSFPEISDYNLTNKINDTTVSGYELPRGIKSHIVTFHLKDEDRAKVNALPTSVKNSAEVAINMDSYQTYVDTKPNTSRKPQDQPRKTYYTTLSSITSFTPSQGTISSSVRAAKYDIYNGNSNSKTALPNSFAYIKSNIRPGNTDWQHTQTVNKGNRTFKIQGSKWVNAPTRAYPYTTKFRVKMYKNGKYISYKNYKVQAYKCVSLVAGSASNKFVTLKPKKAVYSMKSDYCAWDEIKVTTKLSSKASLKVKLDIVSGPKDYRLFNSYVY